MAHTILAYGRTRTTKTSQFRFIAEEVWTKFGKRSRFVTADTGSLWKPIQDLVDADIVRPLFLPIDPMYNAQPAVRKLRRGEWPKDRDKNGYAVLRPAKERPVWESPAQQADFEEIGALGFESLTSYGDGVMRDLREKNIRIGLDPVPGLRTEDGETFAANTQNHYSATHSEILDTLTSVADLPFHYVYITALEGIGEDDDGPVKKAVLGPKVPGKAITEIIPSRVNDCFHFAETFEGGRRELRAYIQSHPSEISSKNWPAGPRTISIPSVLKAVRARWPKGYFVLSEDRGLGEYLDFLPELDRLAKEYTRGLLNASGKKEV